MPARTKTIQQVRKELQVGQRRLRRLRLRRRRLVVLLAALDRQIAGLAGKTTKVRRKRRSKATKVKTVKKARRSRKRAVGKPLVEYIRKVLGKASNGLRAKDIAAAVTTAGYRSSSKDFYGIVAATLCDKKNFRRVRRGVYELAG